MCILYTDSHKHTTANTSWYKKSTFYQTLVEAAAHCKHKGQTAQITSNEEHPSTALPFVVVMVDSTTHNQLISLAQPYTQVADSSSNHPKYSTPEPEPFPIECWGLFEANDDTNLSLSLKQ
jgi:hypothetical protein